MTTRYLSICSGIEAASVAWHPLGWEPLAFAEIEPFPRAVLAHHYPDVPLHGDFTRLRDEAWIGAADVLVGGTPCQAFSVAGKRASLSDDRGNLTLEFVRLADAIDDVRRLEGRDPSVLVWENVPGVLSVKDNAFGCLLAALVGEDAPIVPPGGKWTHAGVVAGPQRQAAWRTLDAQYFGLAQRRRRVFVVASAREGFDPTEVLFEWEGVRRDTPPSREARETVAGVSACGPDGGGRAEGGSGGDLTRAYGGNRTSGPIDVAPSLLAQPGSGYKGDFDSETFVAEVAGTLPAGGAQAKSAGTATGQDAAAGLLVAHSLRGEGFDASEDGTGRGTPIVPVAMRESGPGYWVEDAVSGTLDANMGASGHANRAAVIGEPVAFDTTQITSPSNYSVPKAGDPCHPLAAGAHPPAVAFQTRGSNLDVGEISGTIGTNADRASGSAPMVAHAFDARQSDVIQYGDRTGPLDTDGHSVGVLAFSAKDHGGDATRDLAPTLRAMPHDGSHANGGGQLAVAIEDPVPPLMARSSRGGAQPLSPGHQTDGHMVAVPALTASNDPSRSPQSSEVTQQVAAVHAASMAVRRLTPRECERLQGFPDDYTRIPWKKKLPEECPDGPRYKALGNSMAVPCMRWIGGRVVAELARQVSNPTTSN